MIEIIYGFLGVLIIPVLVLIWKTAVLLTRLEDRIFSIEKHILECTYSKAPIARDFRGEEI